MHFIDGNWRDEGSSEFVSLNPATGKPIWRGKAAGEAEVTAAVAAARAAFPGWAALAYERRHEIAKKFKELVEARKEELALAIAEETGKALWDARSEASAVIAKLGFAHAAYAERTGTRSQPSAGGTAVVRHRPHGVMAVYGPYNFPAHLPNGHIMPALLAGNTVVFKPSEQTPMVGEWMVRLWQQAGIPTGVINLLQGERHTGMALTKQAIDGVLFTGSSATGKAIHAQFAGRPEVILALEMGGNNPMVVSRVNDLAAAVHETLLSAFTGTGQRCTCARRLIVIDWEQSDQFIDRLVKSAEQLKTGAYNESPEPFMGPLISLHEANRLVAAEERLKALGGRILLPLRRPHPDLPFLTPGLIDMTGVEGVPDEEFFGPLLQIYRVKSAEEAIALANRSQYGLSAAILCDDADTCRHLAERIHCGILNVNRQTTGASGSAPFGGIGLSGNHRPAGYYAADYCAYPVASVENPALALPASLPPGMVIA
ncbi:MAG: succinylglutamate-semialdehyde dehydrogenase [Alphaproteobacteria bacterium]